MHRVTAIVCLSLLGAACQSPTQLPTQPSAPPAPLAPISGAKLPLSANGTFTWVSIAGTRDLCKEITSQVGSTWPLWLGMQTDGASVTLTLSEGPPTDDPAAEPPALFVGTREGSTISALQTGNMAALACPGGRSTAPQVGGSLKAVVSGNHISGEFGEVFITSDDVPVFVFSFEADL